MEDIYQELLEYYRFTFGEILNEESIMEALKQTVSPEELRIFFLIPFAGPILEKELLQKAKKNIGINPETFENLITHMLKEAVIRRYTTSEGRVYERCNLTLMSEQQVRNKVDSPKKKVYAEFMDKMIDEYEIKFDYTPYFRAIPVESTVTNKTNSGEFKVDIPIADPRTVLPLDIVSEMVKSQPLIGVADCYCRSAKKAVGKDCGHLIETCFVFNDFAESLIEPGYARKIDLDEALIILKKCEEEGLVHFIDNAEGDLRSMCNCCNCSCVLLKTLKRSSFKAGGGSSRFIISYDVNKCIQCGICAKVCPVDALTFLDLKLNVNTENCIGCGLCVSRCPEGALKLVHRNEYPHIFPTKIELDKHINFEISQQRMKMKSDPAE